MQLLMNKICCDMKRHCISKHIEEAHFLLQEFESIKIASAIAKFCFCFYVFSYSFFGLKRSEKF